MEKKLCGAKTRNGEPCQKAALYNGRCRLHGGKSTGPKDRSKLQGNKNALKHGLYETIWLDTLTEEEIIRYENYGELGNLEGNIYHAAAASRSAKGMGKVPTWNGLVQPLGYLE